MRQEMHLRLMTYNLGGGRKDSGSVVSHIIDVIEETSPDILVVQEATEYEDADGIRHSVVDQIDEKVGFGGNWYFGRTLSMRENMHVRRSIMVRGIFSDWKDWRHGNAVFARWRFVRLGDPSKPGTPRNVPIYLPPVYQGDRDTDPRYAVIARVERPPVYPFVVGVHLTTLVAERDKSLDSSPGRSEEARNLRLEQTRRLLDLLREHVLEREVVVFLLGDFNAVASEPCISALEMEGGFVRLTPSEGPSATYFKITEPIDHILASPSSRLVEYRCWIVDSLAAQQASDHLPVVADVVMSCA
jgi:endonuclease/exonuclease/phosphatase family metal-dependent hydrolase